MAIYKYAVDHRVSMLRKVALTARDIIVGTKILPSAQKAIVTHTKPVLVVGCGHSGTTLLSSRLGLHPDVHVHRSETRAFLPFRLASHSKLVFELLDVEAQSAGAKVLVEKTPKHVHVIDKVRRRLPTSRIVGIVRNPLDNCASLYKRFGDLDLAVERWIIDNLALARASKLEEVSVVKYEDLVSLPASTMSKLYADMSLRPFDIDRDGESLEKQYLSPRNANQTVRFEQVRQSVFRNVGSYRKILNESQIENVLRRTEKLAREYGLENIQ